MGSRGEHVHTDQYTFVRFLVLSVLSLSCLGNLTMRFLSYGMQKNDSYCCQDEKLDMLKITIPGLIPAHAKRRTAQKLQ